MGAESTMLIIAMGRGHARSWSLETFRPYQRARYQANKAHWKRTVATAHERRGLTRKEHPRTCVHPGCGQYARIGNVRCRHHVTIATAYAARLPVIYNKYLGPKLRDRLKEIVGSKSHQEQLQIYDEIAVARGNLTVAMELCTAVLSNDAVTLEQKFQAMELVKEGMEHVAGLCATMSRIEKDLDDRISVRQLGLFVDQLTVLIHNRLGEEHQELARLLANDIDAKLRLPNAQGAISDPSALGRVPVRIVYAEAEQAPEHAVIDATPITSAESVEGQQDAA